MDSDFRFQFGVRAESGGREVPGAFIPGWIPGGFVCVHNSARAGFSEASHLLLLEKFSQVDERAGYVRIFASCFFEKTQCAAQSLRDWRAGVSAPGYRGNFDQAASGSRGCVGEVCEKKVGAIAFLKKVEEFFERVARRVIFAADVAADLALRNFGALAHRCLGKPVLFENGLQCVGEM